MRWLPLLLALAACGRLGFDGSGGTTDSGAGDDAPPGSDASVDGAVVGDPQTVFVAEFAALPATTPPTQRRATGAAVAPDDRIWVFGGFAGASGVQNDTAVFVPTTNVWTTVTTTGTPPARERHVIAWDPSISRLVLFGGYSGTFPSFVHHDELYVFDPATSAWTQIPKAGTWPNARKDSTLVWVPSLGKLLLYGGNSGDAANLHYGDLWTLSINVGTSTATWTLVMPGGVAAPRQSATCAGYDAAARRLILYGGETTAGASSSSTYVYLADTNMWQLDTTTGTSPGPRAFSQCAWDPVAGRLALYGGQDNSGAPIGGTFAYSPEAKRWDAIALKNGSTAPGNCSDGGAAYSAKLGGVFWFGGRTASISYTNQSWVLDLLPQ